MNTEIKIPCGITVEFDNHLFLEIINRYGASGFNAWMESLCKQNLIYPTWDIRYNCPAFQVEFYLNDIDLSNRSLDTIDLTMVYVSKGNFRDSSLYGAKFLIVKNSDFSGADLRTSMFNSCDISGCSFTGAMIEDVNWERAYYQDTPQIGLPADIMSQIKELPQEDLGVTDAVPNKPKRIPCLAEIRDASYWVH